MRHEFAFYTPNASLYGRMYQLEDTCVITALQDAELVHRATQIIRVQSEDVIILFDEHIALYVEVTQTIKKQTLKGLVKDKKRPAPLKPVVHWILPLLERDPFEEAVSFLTILGATHIYPVITEKVHRTTVSEREWSVLSGL